MEETTPLLSSERSERDAEAATLKTPLATPLPKLQLGIVTCIKLVEPVAYVQIFPYINAFISSLHVTDDPKKIGFYSGLVESTFAVFQLVAIYNLSKLSDKIGRRPVLLCGVTGVALTTILFGLSTSFPMMLVVRAIAGLCSGNSAVSQSIVGEITDSSNVGLATAVYGLSWPIGAVLGPLLGGGLSNPAEKFSWLNWEFLRRHPYFLPCGVSGALSLAAVTVGYFFLQESLPSKRVSRQPSFSSECSETETITSAEPVGMKTLLSMPIMFALSGSAFAFSFLSVTFEVIFVLYSYTAVLDGGLGFPPSQIGYSLSISGIVATAIQLLLLPWLLRTFNKAKLYHWSMCIFLVIFPLLSVLNLIARSGFDEATGLLTSHTTAAIWACVIVILTLLRTSNLGYAFSMILVKENCPNSASLGTTNGLITFVQCMARAVGPAFISSTFALSVDRNIMGGFGWLVPMMLISSAGAYQSFKVYREQAN
ncbi:hypothetical protein HWV62_43808 [Athelia sp. TMB]|nr:hypothetical protein HWV62_43808 [Athelia sp. TMB]